MTAVPRKRALEQACSTGHDTASRIDIDDVETFATIDVIKAATERLAAADPRLAGLISTFGPPERLIAKSTSCFRSLAKSILYQQLAGTAAAAIYSRFLAVCRVPDESHLTPASVLSASSAELRGCGLSERKASYLQDLAAHFMDGCLSDELLTSVSDEALLTTLTAVRGIGPWTVDMFSMFHLGRPDILPVGDLGVRKGIGHICGLSHLPSPSEMEELTAVWRPYRSLGCYYMWRIPLPPTRTTTAGRASKASSSRGGKKVQSARVKAPAAAIASPLGAAVAAVADVGVNPLVPMLAAGSIAGVSVVAGTDGAVGPNSSAAIGEASVVGEGGNTQQQQQQQQLVPMPPVTPDKQQIIDALGASAAEQGTPSALMLQLRPNSGSGDAVTGLQDTTAAAAAAPAGGGMMTRRRLRWAVQAQASGT